MIWKHKWKLIPNFEKSYKRAEWKMGEYRAIQQVEQEIRTFYADERFKSEEGKRTLFMHFNDCRFKEKSLADRKAEVYLQIGIELIILLFTAGFLSVALDAITKQGTGLPTMVFVWVVLPLGFVFSYIWGGLVSDWREKPNSAYYQYVVPFRAQLIQELLEQVHHVEFKNGLPVVEPLPPPKATQPEPVKDEPVKDENTTV